MPWKEKWRSEDRPTSREIPDEYRLTANVADNRIMGYFVGILGFSYLALEFIGTNSDLVAGIPVLIWLTVGVSILIIVGLYSTLRNTKVNEETSKVGVEGEVEDG